MKAKLAQAQGVRLWRKEWLLRHEGVLLGVRGGVVAVVSAVADRAIDPQCIHRWQPRKLQMGIRGSQMGQIVAPRGGLPPPQCDFRLVSIIIVFGCEKGVQKVNP